MAPQANWKGFLRLSLVTCPIALFPAAITQGRARHRHASHGGKRRGPYLDAAQGRDRQNGAALAQRIGRHERLER